MVISAVDRNKSIKSLDQIINDLPKLDYQNEVKKMLGCVIAKLGKQLITLYESNTSKWYIDANVSIFYFFSHQSATVRDWKEGWEKIEQLHKEADELRINAKISRKKMIKAAQATAICALFIVIGVASSALVGYAAAALIALPAICLFPLFLNNWRTTSAADSAVMQKNFDSLDSFAIEYEELFNNFVKFAVEA